MVKEFNQINIIVENSTVYNDENNWNKSLLPYVHTGALFIKSLEFFFCKIVHFIYKKFYFFQTYYD